MYIMFNRRKYRRSKTMWTFIFLYCITYIFSTTCNAKLIEVDLFTPGDGLITRDTVSQLDWLDIPLTYEISINEILGGAGGYLDMGFSYATRSEWGVLWQHAGGIGPIDNRWSSNSEDILAGQTLLTLFSGDQASEQWSSLNGKELFQFGALLEEPVANGNYKFTGSTLGVAYGDDDLPDQAIHYTYSIDDAYLDYQIGNAGHYLVRPVPEPTTLAMMGMGLAGIGFMRKRKK